MEGITITHEHPLVFNEDEKALDDQEVLCNGCRKAIKGPTISCVQCKFFLHKACAELPVEMEHTMHSQHRLLLCTTSPYPYGPPFCKACYQVCDGFFYNCFECRFDLDIVCAFEERKIVHAGHHHPLSLLLRKMVFTCDACFKEDRDCAYLCLTCHYCIHKKCAKLPTTINLAEHGHPLTIIYTLTGLTNFYFNCDICRKMVWRDNWSYFCYKCKFIAHLKCALSALESSRDGKTRAEADLNPNLLHLPLTTDIDFITHFVRQNENPAYYRPCSYPGHGLASHFQSQKENLNMNIMLTCDVCVKPISSPFYSCDPGPLNIPYMQNPSICNFFVHEFCSRLPLNIQHPSHPEHPLFLSRKDHFYQLKRCNGCNLVTNGFLYSCYSCNFVLDVKCASLPVTILHDAHKHPLVQGHSSSNFVCDACGDEHSGFRFACESCEYYVAFKCVVRSRFASHRWDKHPLSLIHSPVLEHPDELYCEICEVEIHPKFWFYHCRECDQPFHPSCLPQYDFYSNIKFDGILRHEKHPHPLAFRRRSKTRYKVECKCCGRKQKGQPIFECTKSCDLRICHSCIVDELWK